MVKKVLFVCTGNTCRSPMAEGLLKMKASKLGLPLEIRSAGVSAAEGSPISEHTSTILKEKGFEGEISSHSLEEEGVQWADVILTMTMGHKQAVIHRFPDAADKTFTLKEYVEDDPEAALRIQEWQAFLTELEIKRASKEEIPEEDWQKLAELERNLPDFDIADPFGGPEEAYRQCSEEIERCLEKLVEKWKA